MQHGSTLRRSHHTLQAHSRHVRGTLEALRNASVGTPDLLVVYLHERSMHRVHIRHIHADLEKQSHAAQPQPRPTRRPLPICKTIIPNARDTMGIVVTGPNRPRHNALDSVESHLTAAMSRAVTPLLGCRAHLWSRMPCHAYSAHPKHSSSPAVLHALY